MKHKSKMPAYYGKNIAQNVQRRFFRRKKLEAEQQRAGNMAGGKETSKNR